MMLQNKWLDYAALTAFCGLIFWLSDQPSIPLPQLFEHQDKINHFGAYGVMAILAWRAFRHQQLSNTALFWLSVTYCSLYGISDEWHQSFVPGRDVSVVDWIADTLGACITLWLLPRLLGRSWLFKRVNQQTKSA